MKGKHHLRLLAYAAGFCLSLSTAIGAYIHSSFIEQFVGEQKVGLVYSVAAACSLLASWQGLRLLRRYGNVRTLTILGFANFFALIGATLASQSLAGLPALAGVWLVGAHMVLSFLVAINLDVYLEELSDDRTTGRIRGLFLTANNLAWLCSPLLASQLKSRFDYWAIFALAALALVPFLFIVLAKLRDVVERQTAHLSLFNGLQRVFDASNRDLRLILSIDFLLNFFYAVMIIYLPLYLHAHIGLAWTQIGIVFTIMLIPFVILDFPLGRIADLWLGEKELLTLGLIISAIACLLIPFFTSANLVAWALILLLSRIGAATIEAMKETYLFKHIDGRDANIVFISRNMYPAAYVLAPIITSSFLLFFDLRYIWFALGLVMLLGLPASLKLKDTK